MSTSGRLKMDQVDEAAALMVEEAWKHLGAARYCIPVSKVTARYVNADEGW